MEVLTSARPIYAVLVSLGAVALIGVSSKRPNLREFWTLIAAVLKFSIVVSMLPIILQGKIIEYFLLTVVPGLEVKFRVDALSMIFALIATGLWIVASVYSIGYMRSLNEHAQTRFYMFFAVALLAATGIAFSGNLFTMFIFYEILTLSTYPLVAHQQTREATEGAQKYLAYLLGTSILFLLPAIFLTYYYAGSLEFSNHGILVNHVPNVMVGIILVLFIAGLAKTALMPLHSWLPAAMVAPTPVSALLHAVAVVKAGAFAVIRVVLYVFGVDLLKNLGLGVILAYFASFTIIVASIVALRQDRLKLRLAYSTISQLAYVVLGVALLTPSSIVGSILHIVVHAFGKITLFLAAGAIYVATKKVYVSELDGIGRKMPLTMGAFAVAAISMIGIPPLGGFISKWYLSLGALEAQQLLVIVVLLISSLLNAGYFLPIIYAAFFKEALPTENQQQDQLSTVRELPKPILTAAHLGIVATQPDSFRQASVFSKIRANEAPLLMVIPLLITAGAVIVLFFWPSLFLTLARMVVAAVMA
ncbi:MAG: monovalent cation/H+ antiporter subunit D family protein [Firmicutes bacterium]|nr:monovalent cation/H+ antiporter subunit D family protein [Bacillota bacterium]